MRFNEWQFGGEVAQRCENDSFLGCTKPGLAHPPYVGVDGSKRAPKPPYLGVAQKAV